MPCPAKSETDLDLPFAAFPVLWLAVLVAVSLASNLSTLVLDFQMDPIFDCIILPLYIPGADLSGWTAVGGFGASATIFLCLTACSVWKARLYVCRCVTSIAAAVSPSLRTVFTFFIASPRVDLVSACLALALRGTFFARVSSLTLLFRLNGARAVLSLLMIALLPCTG